MGKLLSSIAIFASLLFCTVSKAEEKEWTVYVHLNGDNDLCRFARKDVQEMKANDMSQTTNWIVAFDCAYSGDSKLIELNGKYEKVLKTGEFDMGDWQFAADTANEVFEKYPSKNKMIVMWNHGSAWRGKGDVSINGISYDDDSGNHISTEQMGQLMERVAAKNHINILAYDACLMQGVETGYETWKYSDYIAASQEVEPGDGWNYMAVSAEMMTSPSPEKLGRLLVDAYINQYPSRSTYSIVSTEGLMELIYELDAMVPELMEMEGLGAIMNSIPGYTFPENKDLGVFLSKLPEEMSRKAREAYAKAIVYNKATMIGTGLSINLRGNPVARYDQLNFSKDFKWDDLLKKIK